MTDPKLIIRKVKHTTGCILQLEELKDLDIVRVRIGVEVPDLLSEVEDARDAAFALVEEWLGPFYSRLGEMSVGEQNIKGHLVFVVNYTLDSQ